MFSLTSRTNQIQGNVCTDWRLSHPLLTKFADKDGNDTQVNTQAFKVFLNPKQVQGVAGSCQDAGYTWKQLDFDAQVKPVAKSAVLQAFL